MLCKGSVGCGICSGPRPTSRSSRRVVGGGKRAGIIGRVVGASAWDRDATSLRGAARDQAVAGAAGSQRSDGGHRGMR